MDVIPIEDRAVRLDAEDREEQYKETRSFVALERWYKRWIYHRLPWFVTGVLLIGVVPVQNLIIYRMSQHKEPPVRVVPVDQTTGWIGVAATPEDAPKVFGEANERMYLRQFVENRYGYHPDMDQAEWDVVRVMSSAEDFERYNAWRKTDVAPIKELGTEGHADVLNVNPGRRTVGKNGTISYLVRFQLRKVKQGHVLSVEPWHANIDFQWHPEMQMTTQEAEWNAGGMQVIFSPAEKE